MSDTNPSLPPKANLADPEQEVEIDSLGVSETWKKRFKWLTSAGGSSMSNLKAMPKEERKKGNLFNVLAFLFGPFYYLAKGMWRKAISFSAAGLVAIMVLELIIKALGFPPLGKAAGYGIAAVFAVRANIDYYKKMVLRENGWW